MTAREELIDPNSTYRAEILNEVRRALLGTTDGDEVGEAFEIPAGEIARILADLASVPAAGRDDTGAADDRVVAYRSRGGRLLRCLAHGPNDAIGDFTPVTSDDLPDGGICTYPDCGTDVLIPAPAKAS